MQHQPVKALAIGQRPQLGAVNQPGNAVLPAIARVGHQVVVAGLELAGIGHRQADLGDELTSTVARIAGSRQRLRTGHAVDGRAGAGLQIQPQRLLQVDGPGHRRHQLAHTVAGIRQIVRLKAHQATDQTVAHLVEREGRVQARHLDGHADLVGVLRIGQRGHLVGVAAQHQGLADADKYAGRAVGTHIALHLDFFGDALDQLVALVKQLIGCLAGVGGAADVDVEVGQ